MVDSVVDKVAELLDCRICYAPFTIPIFQCENGHAACSSCCQHLAHKCPSCRLPIGSIRCRAIENVLESVKLSCKHLKYGCKKTLSYGETYLEHVKTCAWAPCPCLIPGCDYIHAPAYFYFHFQFWHSTHMIRFKHDQTFTVSLTNDDKFVVLGVGISFATGSIFLLNNNRVEQFGNVITISRVAPTSSKESYCYDLTAKIEGTTHTFRSFTKNTPSKFEDKGVPSIGLFLDHVRAASDNGKISLDICIWEDEELIPTNGKAS